MTNGELVVKNQIAELLTKYVSPCKPEELKLSVTAVDEPSYGGRHYFVSAELPNGDEYHFRHWPGHGFALVKDEPLPDDVETWLDEQSRVQTPQREH